MKLILPNRIRDRVEPHLSGLAPNCTVVHIDDDGVPDGDLSDATIFLRWWTPLAVYRRVLAAAPAVRWIHTPSAGVDHVLIPEVTERGILLTNSVGAHAVPIAEFVLMFMLNHAKHAPQLYALTPEDAWPRGEALHFRELAGRTLLIIGLGHIGEEIARRAAAFGMRIIGSRRRPRPTPHVDLVVGDGEWRQYLPEADYVILATPLTAATRGMFDAAAFAAMRPDGYLINVARGQVVDTPALLDALHQHAIAGAALDVLPKEPLPPDHPLWSAPNVWITPHITAHSPLTDQRMVDIFLENIRRYAVGESLINIVDQQAGY